MGSRQLYGSGAWVATFRRLRLALYLASLSLAFRATSAQTSFSSTDASRPTIRSTSELVIVPALVRSSSGEPLTDLQASDFRVSDNGIEQRVFVEQGRGQPLAVVVVMQTGGVASSQLQNYSKLDKMIEETLGGSNRALALVTFDSRPDEIWGFPPLVDGLYYALTHQEGGDNGAAILDAVSCAIQLLEPQPPNFRRIILLLSQGQDHGSEGHAEDVLQLLGKNNTTVYSLMFSSENNAKRRRRGRHDSASSSVSAISNAIRTASAEQLAAQSGGESATFSDQGELEKQLVTFADDIDNEYILSFTPSSRQFGLHTIVVQIDKAAPATITARKTYWLENTSKH